MNEVDKIIESLRVLGVTGDALFDRIRNDIERGLTREAREHLNFVDQLVEVKHDGN